MSSEKRKKRSEGADVSNFASKNDALSSRQLSRSPTFDLRPKLMRHNNCLLVLSTGTLSTGCDGSFVRRACHVTLVSATEGDRG